MIYIKQNESNDIILTLTECSIIDDPVYLFKFTWETDVDLASLYWIGTDLSGYKYRYNQFKLIEGTDVDFRIGQYMYEVYESSTGSTPADETGLNLVEEGRAIVSGIVNNIYD